MIIIREHKIVESISVVYPSSTMPVRVKMSRKPTTIDYIIQNSNAVIARCVIQAIFCFQKIAEWDKFKNNLSMKISAFSNFGGTVENSLNGVVKCVGPRLAGDPAIYVNPEGYDYARYAGVEV